MLNVEPEADVAGGVAAVAALKQAKSVMAFTPFVSDTLLDVCDVLLPIAPFTETSGSFINMEGRLQSFHGVVKGLGESRPLWKILRVLGNLLELEGFEYDSSEQILHDALDAQRLPEKLNNRSSWQGEAAPAAAGLIRTGGVGIYHTDAIVRRAEALQQTSHAQVPPACVHPDTPRRSLATNLARPSARRSRPSRYAGRARPRRRHNRRSRAERQPRACNRNGRQHIAAQYRPPAAASGQRRAGRADERD